MNIALCGFMGCGKTTVGKELASVMGMKFTDTDNLIENKAGITISEIFEKHGEKYFRVLEYEVCSDVSKMNNCVISLGGGAVMYERNSEAIKKGATVVFLDIPFNVIYDRIGDTDSRPLFKDKKSAEQLFVSRREQYIKVSDCILEEVLTPRESAMKIAEMCRK